MAMNPIMGGSLHSHIQSEIDNVLINGSIVISSLDSESASTTSYTVVFTVTQADTTQINTIALRNAANVERFSYSVNIPVSTDDAIIKKIISIV